MRILAYIAKSLTVALLCGVFAFAAEGPATDTLARHKLLKQLQKEDDLRSLCSGLKKCMDIDFPGCSVGDKHLWPKVKYDDEFCKPYKELANRGYKADPGTPMVPEVYARLGRQYRVEYVYSGTLPLNENVIKYLFDNISTGLCRIAQDRSWECATCSLVTDMRKF